MAEAKQEVKDKTKEGAEKPSEKPATDTRIAFKDGTEMDVQELAPRPERARRGMRRGRDDKTQAEASDKKDTVAKRPHIDMKKSKEKESRPDSKFEWGASMREAFEGQAMGMFGYMTELDTVEIKQNIEVEASGHDLPSLLFNFLHELLCKFAEDAFIAKEVRIVKFDDRSYSIRAVAKGEEFSLEKHPQGTEIKAITWSNLTIKENKQEGRIDIWVILDI